MSSHQTPYAETEALLAVMEKRNGDAFKILEDMYPNELDMFRDQVNRLGNLIDVVRSQK
jgi:hypothetical protein